MPHDLLASLDALPAGHVDEFKPNPRVQRLLRIDSGRDLLHTIKALNQP